MTREAFIQRAHESLGSFQAWTSRTMCEPNTKQCLWWHLSSTRNDLQKGWTPTTTSEGQDWLQPSWESTQYDWETVSDLFMLYLMQERTVSSVKVNRERVHFFYTPALALKDPGTRPILKLTGHPLLHSNIFWGSKNTVWFTLAHPPEHFHILLETATPKQPTGQDAGDGGQSPCQGRMASWRWGRVSIHKVLKTVGKTGRACGGHLLGSGGL